MADNLMTSEPNTKPNPDPTIATNEAVARATKSERDYANGKIDNLITRLDAMDEATRVLSDNVNRTPTLLQTAIKNFGDLMDEKFKAISEKFASAESLRLEQKADAKTGLDAALSAQKEAAATQDINNQKAIDKSERATAEIIKNNQDANKQAIDTLTKGLDELKLDVSKNTASKQGVQLGVDVTKSDYYRGLTLAVAVITAIVSTVILLVHFG
jgi:hypothetical protein